MQKDLCRAVGNMERARLIVCLVKEKNVSEILKQCTLSQSALSQHLKILREEEVVSFVKKGKEVFYRVKDKKALKIAKLLIQ